MNTTSTTNSEVIVVGAGLVAGAISLALLEEGLRVSQIRPVAERADCASLAAGAMLGAFAEITADKNSPRDNQETAFRVRASSLYPEWIRSISQRSGTVVDLRFGTFIVANTFGRNDLKNITAIEKALRDFKAPFQSVEEGDVPGYRPNERYAPRKVLWLPEEGFIDTSLLVHAIDAANESYATFSAESAPAEHLIIKADAVTGVVLRDGRAIEGNHVVLAAGVGTQHLLESIPQDIRPNVPRLMPGKGTALILATSESFPYVLRSPNRDFACGIHIVPRGAGTIYVGATNRTAACPGTSPGASVEELHDLLHEVVHEFNTSLDAATLSSVLTGSRPISVDGYPLIGATDYPGLSIATGTYRNGVLMAPLIGRILAEEICGKPSSEVNPFSPRGRKVREDSLSSHDLFRSGAEGIVSFLPSPHGSLPYKRSEELSGFLNSLLSLALKDDESIEALRDDVRGLIQSQPMNETFAQLFFLLAEKAAKKEI